MNIFEQRILEKMGLSNIKIINGKDVTMKTVKIVDGVPWVNYEIVLPSTIENVNVDFSFDFSKDD
jgi:hypothetical protein